MTEKGDDLKKVAETVEALGELARAAVEAQALFEERLRVVMTPELAREVRDARVIGQWTWRAIALNFSGRPELRGMWSPTSNQLAGMALCCLAARHFDEDYEAPPWN